jgi:hypothetical protein
MSVKRGCLTLPGDGNYCIWHGVSKLLDDDNKWYCLACLNKIPIIIHSPKRKTIIDDINSFYDNDSPEIIWGDAR